MNTSVPDSPILCVNCSKEDVTLYTKIKLCSKCYYIKKRSEADKCSTEGCNSPEVNKKYHLCVYHNRKRLRKGERCKGFFGKCGREVKSKGLCPTHIIHEEKGLGVNLEVGFNPNSSGICSYDGCEGEPKTWGVCRKHEYDYQKNHDPESFYKRITKGNHTRRAKLAETTNDQSTELDVISAWGNFCYLCETKVADSGVPIREIYNTEHVIPISRGGTHTIDNLRPSCSKCNKSKGSKTLNEYLEVKNRPPLSDDLF